VMHLILCIMHVIFFAFCASTFLGQNREVLLAKTLPPSGRRHSTTSTPHEKPASSVRRPTAESDASKINRIS
jgi:hypothetical protein